jgi:hypothetical protein
MKSNLRELFGGFDTLAGGSKTLTVSGGFTKNNKHVEHRIIIGDITKNFVKNKIIEWDTFKHTYYNNGKIDQKHYNNFLNMINDVYPLPIYTTDENEILFLVSNIYKAKPIEIINALMKSVNIFISLKSSIRHLFMIYKVYIEKMIEIYIDLRNQYIDKSKLSKTNETNDFNELSTRWNIIDAENGVDTSSPILFFNFHPSTIKFEKSIPKFIWGIKSSDPKHKKVNNAANDFLNIIKKNNFEYVGYCPHASIHRFKLLLKFPIKKLIDLIKIIDCDNKYPDINNSCNNITKKIISLQPKISMINNSIKPTIKIKLMHVKDIQKFPKGTKIPQKIKCFEQYIYAFIQLYKDLIPHLIKKEKLINKLSIDINLISEDLQTMSNSF